MTKEIFEFDYERLHQSFIKERRNRPDPSTGEWIVHTFGGPNKNYEISVLRKNNIHGQQSYGWHDKNKKHISSSGGPCNYKVDTFTWKLLIEVANKVARKLNES